MQYKIERERWIPKESDSSGGIIIHQGYDETYYEVITADYYGVDEHGTAMFYRKIYNGSGMGVGYTVQAIASYAEGQWQSIKEVNDETL